MVCSHSSDTISTLFCFLSGISHTLPGMHKKGLPMLQLKKIRKEYKTGDLVQTALNDVSLNLRDSEFVAILGPSGSGKTTLLNILGGMDSCDEGNVWLDGQNVSHFSARRAPTAWCCADWAKTPSSPWACAAAATCSLADNK